MAKRLPFQKAANSVGKFGLGFDGNFDRRCTHCWHEKALLTGRMPNVM
jgi:hypothetical protein